MFMRKLVRTRSTGRRNPAPAEVLLRGLSIIEALNRRPVSSVEQIAQETALPKSTIVRMLLILASKGYAERLPHRRGYRLGERVPLLAAGYDSREAIVNVARPLLSRFTAEHKWPVTIATLDVDAMRNRAGTLEESPFSTSVDQGRMTRRVPILRSAVGLAYLAFCPPDEREIVLRLLAKSKRPHDQPARDRDAIGQQVAGIVTQGYALSPPIRGEPAIGFAVPVRVDGRVLACITLRYLGKAVSEQHVVKRYFAALQQLASAIAAAFLAQQRAM